MDNILLVRQCKIQRVLVDSPTVFQYVKAPVYETLHEFLGGETNEHDGRNQMFILADAGMGKTSLLLMLKLWHLFSFWPKGYDCLLLKLGEKSLVRIAAQESKANTVLLLDALDEDPLARGRIGERLKELLDASCNDRQVETYLRKRFPDPWHSLVSRRADPHRLKAQAILSSMKSLRFRPLLLAHVDELLKVENMR